MIRTRRMESHTKASKAENVMVAVLLAQVIRSTSGKGVGVCSCESRGLVFLF